jgi:hypothetical protein
MTDEKTESEWTTLSVLLTWKELEEIADTKGHKLSINMNDKNSYKIIDTWKDVIHEFRYLGDLYRHLKEVVWNFNPDK